MSMIVKTEEEEISKRKSEITLHVLKNLNEDFDMITSKNLNITDKLLLLNVLDSNIRFKLKHYPLSMDQKEIIQAKLNSKWNNWKKIYNL